MANEPKAPAAPAATTVTAEKVAQNRAQVTREIMERYNTLRTSGERAVFSNQCRKAGLPRPWLKASMKQSFLSELSEWKAKMQAPN
jgi:hypothetical protein